MKHINDYKNFLNEGATKTRDEVIAWIEKTMRVTGTTEEFNGTPDGIWLCGECGDKYKGKVIYSYYSNDIKNYEMGVLKTWENQLNKMGWYSQWYDAGTMMIYKS